MRQATTTVTQGAAKAALRLGSAWVSARWTHERSDSAVLTDRLGNRLHRRPS